MESGELSNDELEQKPQFFRGLVHVCSHWLWLQLPGDSPSYHSPGLWPRSPSSHTKGLAAITALRCIKSNLPEGRFDWLKHGIAASVAIFHAEEWKPTALHQRSCFIIHIYTCSHWNIYTFTVFIYVLLLIYSPLAVFLIYLGRFACCVFSLLSYSFFAAHLVEKRSRELMMEAGGKDKKRMALIANFLKTLFWSSFCIVLFKETGIVYYLHRCLILLCSRWCYWIKEHH